MAIEKDIPVHYQTVTGFDAIEFSNIYGLNFNRGSAVKYLARAGKKGDVIEDLKKAVNFIQREIEFLERNNEQG